MNPFEKVEESWRASLVATQRDLTVLAASQTLRPPPGPAPAPPSLPVKSVTLAPGVDGKEREFELGAVLGQGGMGVVYRAVQLGLGREVAVKALGPEASARPELVDAFLTEARVTARLDHPNVVPIYGLARDDAGRPLLGMKKIDGRAWQDALRADPPSSSPEALRRHLEVFRRVLDGIAFAHERGVIHRDLKPANVMVGAHGQVYVVDWGLAVELEANDKARPICPGGTPAYMAPEMARTEDLSRATDVYLLGAILHEVLCGRPPHARASALEALCSAHNNEVPPLGSLPDGTPHGLAAIVARCLQTDAADRFADARALRAEVDQVFSGEKDRHEAEAIAERATALLEAPLVAAPGDKAAAAALYGRLFEADARVQSALLLWSESPRALALRARLHVALIECALSSGDLTLAERFLERAKVLNLGAGLEAKLELARREADPATIIAFEKARGYIGGVSSACVLGLALACLLAVPTWLGTTGSQLGDPASIVEFTTRLGIPGLVLESALYLASRRLTRRRWRDWLTTAVLGYLAWFGSAGLLIWIARATAHPSPWWWLSLVACLPLIGHTIALGPLIDRRVRALFSR